MQPTIFQAVHSSLGKNYSNFKGRACRAEFWWTMLFYVLVEVALTGAIGFISSFYWDMWMDPTKIQIALVIFSLPFIVPNIALLVRRLHDTGKTGWWLLLAFVPAVGFFIILFFCIQEGNYGDNKYGPEPY